MDLPELFQEHYQVEEEELFHGESQNYLYTLIAWEELLHHLNICLFIFFIFKDVYTKPFRCAYVL